MTGASFLRESGRTSVLIGLGVAVKMLVDLVVAASFGLGIQTDAFFVAYTVPLMIEALIYPACQSGLVPVFVRHMGQTDNMGVLFSTLVNIGLMVSVVLAALGLVTAPWIVTLIAPGVDPETHDLALRLARILFLGTFFVGPVGVMRAFLNANRLFAAPAMLEFIRGIVVLCIIAVGFRLAGIEALAVGFTIGGSVQCVFLAIVVFRRIGPSYQLAINLKLLQASQTGQRFAVPIADYLLAQAILVAQRIIGSFLPAGSISAISYGHRLASVITVTLFAGMEVVSLPAMAADLRAGTESHLERARETFDIGLRFTFILGIPVAITILVLSFPLTRLLFERGAFGQRDTALAAPVIGLYALSIPFWGHWLLLKNYLYAAFRPRQLLSLAAVATGTTVGLYALLWRPLGANGVAIAYSGGVWVVYGLSFLVLEVAFRPRQHATLSLAIRSALASIIAGLSMSGIVEAMSRFLSRISNWPDLAINVSSLFMAGVVGALLFLAVLLLLRVREAAVLMKRLRKA